jgi:lipid A disaccharide synthetase
LLITIDSPDFSFRVAQLVKAASPPRSPYSTLAFACFPA